MEKLCLIGFVFCLSAAFFLQSCLAEDLINGNISVVLQNLEVNLFVLKGRTTTRHVDFMPPNSPVLRPPCRTCDPTYNLFHIDKQYLIPNHSKIYALNPNSVAPPTGIDIGNCNPVQLHSVKSNVIWVQCAFEDGRIEVVELRRQDNVTWYQHNSQNIRVFSTDASRNGLVLVKEKDGENVTFLYYGDGGRLVRKGLEEFSLVRYTKPLLLCETVEELFFINDKLILIQCVLRNTATEHGLVLFNTSNPSQLLTLFHRFYTYLMKVHVFEDYIVLVSHDTIIIRNAVRLTGIEQLIALPPELSTNGIFIRLKGIIYFVCTSKKEIYLIDISRVLAGNVTAFHRIESEQEICTDTTCSPMQYIGPLLFVPLRTNELAMYTLDPIKLHATANILTGQYRYFFTYTILATKPRPSESVTNETIALDRTTSEESKSDGPSNGVIAGIAVVASVVIILSVLFVAGSWYWYKKRPSRYYQYQTAEVRFERRDNDQSEGIVIVPGRFNNPVWEFTDNNETTEEESSVPTAPLNNQSATSSRKKKNTNMDGGYVAMAPSNIDYNEYDDDDGTGSYGFETRQEPVDRREYVDSLVIGTFTQSN